MSNFKALDKDSNAIEFKADGIGSSADPFIPHHVVISSALPANAATEANQELHNTKLDEIALKLAEISAYNNALQQLMTALNGYVDGLEALLITANATQTSLADFVDQIEGFVDEVEIKLGTLNDKDFATETTLDALLTELQGKADASETQPVVVANFPTTQQVSFSDSALITETALTAAGSTPARSCAGYKYLTYQVDVTGIGTCLLYTSPSPRDS